MFSDDFYIDALGRQAAVVKRAQIAHDQDLLDGLDCAESAKVLAFERGAYETLVRRATPVQLIVHAAEQVQIYHSR